MLSSRAATVKWKLKTVWHSVLGVPPLSLSRSLSLEMGGQTESHAGWREKYVQTRGGYAFHVLFSSLALFSLIIL